MIALDWLKKPKGYMITWNMNIISIGNYVVGSVEEGENDVQFKWLGVSMDSLWEILCGDM